MLLEHQDVEALRLERRVTSTLTRPARCLELADDLAGRCQRQPYLPQREADDEHAEHQPAAGSTSPGASAGLAHAARTSCSTCADSALKLAVLDQPRPRPAAVGRSIGHVAEDASLREDHDAVGEEDRLGARRA